MSKLILPLLICLSLAANVEAGRGRRGGCSGGSCGGQYSGGCEGGSCGSGYSYAGYGYQSGGCAACPQAQPVAPLVTAPNLISVNGNVYKFDAKANAYVFCQECNPKK